MSNTNRTDKVPTDKGLTDKNRPLCQIRIYLAYLVITAVVIISDQISKFWVVDNIEYRIEQIQLLPVFGIVHAHNYGAAFSFLNEEGGMQVWFFGTIAVVMSIVLLVWLRRAAAYERQLSIALALILGGAIGNLIDRLYYGYVIDFIWVHYQSFNFPAFNVADSAISIGAVLLIMDSFGWKLLADRESLSAQPLLNK